jgi:hypothetical protein
MVHPVGFLKKLRIVPGNTSFIYDTKGPDGRDINTLTNSQDRFATILGVKTLTNKDWYDSEGALATYIEDLHYGRKEVPRSISSAGIFVAVPEVISQSSRFGDKVCWGAVLDIDCHGHEKEVNWDEVRQNAADLNERFGLEYIWNRSRGGGLHLWYLFTEAVELGAASKFIANVRKKLLDHSLIEFRSITEEIRKAFGVDVRPSAGSQEGQNQRIAMPNGFYYQNPHFGMSDVVGRIELEDEDIHPQVGGDAVLAWQSSTRIGKTKKVKEHETEVIAESGMEWLRAFLENRRLQRSMTRPEWRDNNKWPDTPTDMIVAQVRGDEYFRDVYDEIGEIFPCILARIAQGPTLGHNWHRIIFNVSLSCLALIGHDEVEDQERALDLVTLIMNHPRLDWMGNPQDREYYRRNGSFNGALKWIREDGKPPSCQSVPEMQEHCRPEHCAMCQGGFPAVARQGAAAKKDSHPYLFNRVYINDPFEPVERRVRYISEEFVVDPNYTKTDMMFRLNDAEALDPNRFILAIQDRTPRCYDFSDMIEFCESQMQNKKVWGTFWTRILRDPKEETVEFLIHGARFLGKLAQEIKEGRFQPYDQVEQQLMASRDSETTIWLYIHQNLVIRVTRKIITELRTSADEVECARVYMQKLLGAEGAGVHWKIRMAIAESNALLIPAHHMHIFNSINAQPLPTIETGLPSELHKIGDKDMLH